MIEVILAFSLYIDYLCKYYPDMEGCTKEKEIKLEKKKKDIPGDIPLRISREVLKLEGRRYIQRKNENRN